MTTYFEKYGKVLEVRLIGKLKMKRCFIYFGDPKEATKVLQESYHVFMESIIRVEPCHDFRQPGGQAFVQYIYKQLKNEATQKQTTNITVNKNVRCFSILHLNDDCLYNICSYLRLDDQINFALACPRFYNILIMFSKIKYSTLDGYILSKLSLWKARIFLQIVGPQLKHLHICTLVNQPMFKIFGRFCLNVKKLKVVFCKNLTMPHKLIKNMTLIQELDFNGNLNDSFVKYLKRLKHLKTLSLRSKVKLTGRYIYLLKGLNKLLLDRCASILPKHFKKICENLTNLIELNIKECDLLKIDDYEHICKHLQKLETLRLSALEENFECILQLPNLKNLEIIEYDNRLTPDIFVKKLAELKANQLQELTLHNKYMSFAKASSIAELKSLTILCCNCDKNEYGILIFSNLTELKEVILEGCGSFPDEVVLRFLEKSLKLKKATFEFCDGFTPELIRNLVNVLQKQDARWLRTNRLDLKLIYKNICRSRVKEFLAMNTRPNLLKLTMDYTSYNIVCEEAFTKDNILIFNVKALFVPGDVTIEKITTYFRKFGKIVDVRMIEDTDQKISPQYFKEDPMQKYVIQYSDAKSAARALQVPMHSFNNQCIQVEACDSSEQPDGQTIIKRLNTIFGTNAMENINIDCNNQNKEAYILTLNDDCLEHICKFLKLPDQINFALSCQRFSYILALLSKVQMKKFDTFNIQDLTPFQSRIFLQIVGPQINTLTVDIINHNWEKQIIFLGMFLINVKNLKVIENSSDLLRTAIQKMPFLQELELVRTNFDDEFIKSLETLKNLKSLKILVNNDITGFQIHKITALKKLTINRCRRILANFKSICKDLKNLTYLDIGYRSMDDGLMTQDYEHIVKYLLQLRTLKIACKEGSYNCVAKLPNLKILYINFVDENLGKPTELFRNLVEHKANQLEELSIKIHNFSMEDAILIAKLRKLKVLKCNFSLNDEMMEKFYDLKDIESVEFYVSSEFTDDGILKLLENCLKLKRIRFWDVVAEQSNLTTKSSKLLQIQRDRGKRAGSVTFVFNQPLFDMSFDREAQILQFPDILNVIFDVDDAQEYHGFEEDCYDDRSSNDYHFGDYEDYEDYDNAYDVFDDYDDDYDSDGISDFYHFNAMGDSGDEYDYDFYYNT